MLKSFKEIDEVSQLIHELKKNGQGENHAAVAVHLETVLDGQKSHPKTIGIDLICKSNDYAVTRSMDGSKVEYFLVGFLGGGETGLFSHQLPSDGICYEESTMSQILDYANRRHEGFRRVQGDVIARKVADCPGLSENTVRELQNMAWQFGGGIKIGNSHEIRGCFPWVKSRNEQTMMGGGLRFARMASVAVYVDQFCPVDLSHPEHKQEQIASAVPAMWEITTQNTEPQSSFASD